MHFDLRKFFPNISNDVITDIVWQGCTKKVTSADDAWQNVHTPDELCIRMINKFDDMKGKILVLFNVEFIKELLHRGVKQENVYILIDSKAKERFVKDNFDKVTYKRIKGDKFKDFEAALRSFVMKFDKIIMNPPYNKNLHLKILAEAIKHLSDDGVMVSLQPIVKWQMATLLNENIPVENTYVSERIPMDEASSLFKIEQRCELGIITNVKSKETEIIDNFQLLNKIKIGLENAIKRGGLLKDKFEKIWKDYPIAFGMGCPLANHGGHGKSCYRITGKFDRATQKTDIGHSIRFNAANETEQKRVHHFYADNQMMRFIYKEFGFGNAPYHILPFIDGFVDSNGKTGLDYDWGFEDLCKYFQLTYEDLIIIKKSLANFLYDDESKIIEETMEKYK